MTAATLAESLSTLFTEVLDGSPGKYCFVLNRGDAGLLRSLDELSAEAASRSADGGATIAAHVDHLRYGLSLLNRWSAGDDPWSDADWARSWRIGAVSEDEWRRLRAALRDEARRWQDHLRQPRDHAAVDLNGVIGSVVHLAYHLGAIRQIDRTTRGPQA